MYNITLLRHAESEGNVDLRVQGHIDSPLTRFGLQQAETLANRWKTENRLSLPLTRKWLPERSEEYEAQKAQQ